MSWQSNSSGEKITAVRLPRYHIFFWEDEPDKFAEERLKLAVVGGLPFIGWDGLEKLFEGKKLVSFKRQKKEKKTGKVLDGQFDLYILARFGFWYVGIKTVLVEV